MYEPVHVLSRKSVQQQRNVFVWCTQSHRLALGWHVGTDSPVTVSTAYRWISEAVKSQYPRWKEAESYILSPVELTPSMVMTYSVRTNGPALSRESQDIMAPGDYGLYTSGDEPIRLYALFHPAHSFADAEEGVREISPSLFAKAALSHSLIQLALDRDRECIFSGVVSTGETDALVATWVFPPFLGHKNDPKVQNEYYTDPDACDLSEWMVVENVVSGRKDIVTLFRENKLGIDVDDNYRIVVFEGLEHLSSGALLKSHLTLPDGPKRPSDRFLRLHFNGCLAVSVCRGDVIEDFEDQEIENFMEELGVYDNEINDGDPRWSTTLGSHVHAYLVRQQMAGRECGSIW